MSKTPNRILDLVKQKLTFVGLFTVTTQLKGIIQRSIFKGIDLTFEVKPFNAAPSTISTAYCRIN